MSEHADGARTPTQNNLHGLDYRAEAARLGAPPVPIIDSHSHINGARASRVYLEARRLYGVTVTYTQTRIDQADIVRDALGDSVRFVAVPRWQDKDLGRAHTEGYLEDLAIWRETYGARMAKFWTAPRIREIARDHLGDINALNLDSPWRQRQMQRATDLGMMIMTHIADPDTWFATKYADASTYMAKKDHYIAVERLADRFTQPWLVAHMGGWPENLPFLDGLLSRHPNLHLDTSATKWMVRELSRHPREELLAFLEKHRGRVFFGSDIVTTDDHLRQKNETEMKAPVARYLALASSEDEAFDLYASRYWALRTMFETAYDGESPISDGDLAMVDPGRHTPMSAPRLRGFSLPMDLLRVLYRDGCAAVFEAWWRR